MSTTPGSGSLRARLRDEAEARTQGIAEVAARTAAEQSEARIRDVLAQATADLSGQAERLERVARQLMWVRVGTVVLALAAGAMGGAATALILWWIG